MSSLVENATIKIRRDSAANWTSNNPTPASGEWCYETDTRHIKIGDGSTAWNSLTYHIGGSDIKNITTASDETETLPDPANIGGTYTIGRFGAGTGKATFNAPSGVTIRWPDGFSSSRIVFEGGGNATVVERAGELYVQEYEDSGSNSNGDWWKHVDGSMRQTVDYGSSVAVPNGLGAIYYTASPPVLTFPKTFASVSKIYLSNLDGTNVPIWAGKITYTLTNCTVYLLSAIQNDSGRPQGEVLGTWDRDAA